MGTNNEPVWLTYAEAAKRVKSSPRTIKRWRQAGMPMEWRLDSAGNEIERVVELQVLLSWWRARMQASPVHFYRIRAAAIERGDTPPPLPDNLRRKQQNKRGVAHNSASNVGSPAVQASEALNPSRVSQNAAERTEAAFTDLPPFHGQAEHAALVKAMQHETPGCDGLEVFTRDRYSDPAEVEMMRGICRVCPLLDLCAAFAAAGRPTAGMWAGMTPAEVRSIGTSGYEPASNAAA